VRHSGSERVREEYEMSRGFFFFFLFFKSRLNVQNDVCFSVKHKNDVVIYIYI